MNVDAAAATVGGTSPALPLLMAEDERALRESVRKIVSAYGPDAFQRSVVDRTQMDELWQTLGQQGFLGVHLPEQYGGGGGGLYDLAVVLDEAASVGCPLATIVYSPGIGAPIIARHGTEQQRQAWLPGLASGEKMFAFAITEPDAGTNSHNIATAAVKKDGVYRINGQKYYTSGVESAEKILVVVRTGVDEVSGRGKLSLLLVDSDAPGLTRTPIGTALAVPEQQWNLFFDDVEVGQERLVGVEGKGLRAVFDGLNPERILVSAMCVGIGRYALAKAAKYATERSVWGVPIGTHQGVAHPLAEAAVELEHGWLMTQKAALLYDAMLDCGEQANMAKLMTAQASVHCLDAAIQTHGGNGMADEYQLTNYWFIARANLIAPVSKQMVLNHVAQHYLGLPKSY